MRLVRTVSCLVLILFSVIYPSDKAITALDGYMNQVKTAIHGMAQNSVFCITKDRTGYLWLATGSGLSRFNGLSFENFNKFNTPEIRHNTVTAILNVSGDRQWFGTYGGGIFIRESDRFFSLSELSSLNGHQIWKLYLDSQGTVWIVSNRGVFTFTDHRLMKLKIAEDTGEEVITDVAEDLDGNLWVGSEKGLSIIPTRKVNGTNPAGGIKKISDSFKNRHVTSICPVSTELLLVGTASGVFRVSLSDQKVELISQMGDLFCRKVIKDYQNRIWIASDSGIFFLSFNQQNLMEIGRFDSELGLSSNSVMDIFPDSKGTLFIGTSDKGLNILSPNKTIGISKGAYKLTDAINGITEDHNGAVWVASEKGGELVRIDPEFRPRDRVTGRNVRSLLSLISIPADRTSTLLSGTREGLFRTEMGQLVKYRIASDIDLSPIHALHRLTSGEGVVGGYAGGIFILNLKSNDDWQLNQHRFPGKGIEPVCFSEIEAGILLCGTNRGLFRIQLDKEGLRVKKIDLKPAILNRLQINTIYYCRESGLLLYGSEEDGIYFDWKGDRGKLKSNLYLINRSVYGILEDRNAHLWMSTNKGIIRLSKRNLLNYLNGKSIFLNAVELTERDGMDSAVCSGGFYPSGLVSSRGRIYFPTRRGVTVVDPAAIEENASGPPLLFKEIRFNGIRFNKASALSLQSKTTGLELDVEVIDLIAPEKIKIRYILEGRDKQWHEKAYGGTIGYKRLKPGKYLFKVIASDSNGNWNYEGASFRFTIRSSIFRSMPFQLGVAAVLFSLILGFLWYIRFRREAIGLKQIKYQYSMLKSGKMEASIPKLIALMEDEKLYLNPELTITDVADRIGLTEKILSQIINQHYKVNFKNFVNKYRVNEAKTRLLDPREREFVILKIAYESGFNSKSVFNAAFKKFTGMSPSEFRKSHS